MTRLTAVVVAGLSLLSCGSPSAAWPTANVLVNPDPAALDDALAALERTRADNEIIVMADATGCGSADAEARPTASTVQVTFTFAENACDQLNIVRALFVLPASGENELGEWSYDASPVVDVTAIRNG